MGKFNIRATAKVPSAAEFSKNLKDSPALMLSVMNQILRKAGAVYVPALKSETPTRTRKLRNSTVMQIKGTSTDMRAEVRQNAKSASGGFYGHYVREGTRPHIIQARKGRVLSFMIGNKRVFATKVKHPGNKSNPYHVRAMLKVRGQIDNIMSAAGVRISVTLSNVKKVF